MALTPCPACGRQMSTLAERCPHCGDDGAGPEMTVPINGGSDESPEAQTESSIPPMTMEALQGWFALQNPEDVWLVEDAGGKRHMPMTLAEVAERFVGEEIFVQHPSWERSRLIGIGGTTSGYSRPPSVAAPDDLDDRTTIRRAHSGAGRFSSHSPGPGSLFGSIVRDVTPGIWLVGAVVALLFIMFVVASIGEAPLPTSTAPVARQPLPGHIEGASVDENRTLHASITYHLSSPERLGDIATGQFWGDAWLLATTFPQAGRLVARIRFSAHDRFGQLVHAPWASFETDLTEIRRYRDASYLMSDEMFLLNRSFGFMDAIWEASLSLFAEIG